MSNPPKNKQPVVQTYVWIVCYIILRGGYLNLLIFFIYWLTLRVVPPWMDRRRPPKMPGIAIVTRIVAAARSQVCGAFCESGISALANLAQSCSSDHSLAVLCASQGGP